MTDDELRRYLRPRTHWGAFLSVGLAVAAAVWAGTEWLHSRASNDDTKNLQNEVVRIRLDASDTKGEIKAINVRLDEGFKALNFKMDVQQHERRGR